MINRKTLQPCKGIKKTDQSTPVLHAKRHARKTSSSIAPQTVCENHQWNLKPLKFLQKKWYTKTDAQRFKG